MKSQLAFLILFFLCVSHYVHSSEALLAVENQNSLSLENNSNAEQSSAPKYKRIVLYEELVIKAFSSSIDFTRGIYQIGRYCIPVYNTSLLSNRRTTADIYGFTLDFNFNNGLLIANRDYSFDVNIYDGDIGPNSNSKRFVESCYNSYTKHYRNRNATFKISCMSRVFKPTYVVAICANTSNSLQSPDQTINTRVSGYILG